MARLRATVELLASQGSRISGYPGADRAAEYVFEQFAQSDLQQVVRQEFPVTVPIDRGAQLQLVESGEQLSLFCLWPNQVRTPTLPPEGLRAQMIYGGLGTYREFDGHELLGQVVLMEFNSRNHWLRAASLGARAIVFIEPEETTWNQATDKFSTVPLDIPRFWINRQEGLALRRRLANGELEVQLTGRMDWEQRPARTSIP